MATFVYKDASAVINTVDLSDHVRSLTLNTSADAPDDTNMGDTSRGRLDSGLEDWSVDIDFSQDFAASEVDATLDGCLGTSVTVTFKPTSAAVGATNPSYSGSAIMTSYGPLDGAVGDAATTRAHFEGNGALTRATS